MQRQAQALFPKFPALLRLHAPAGYTASGSFHQSSARLRRLLLNQVRPKAHLQRASILSKGFRAPSPLEYDRACILYRSFPDSRLSIWRVPAERSACSLQAVSAHRLCMIEALQANGLGQAAPFWLLYNFRLLFPLQTV